MELKVDDMKCLLVFYRYETYSHEDVPCNKILVVEFRLLGPGLNILETKFISMEFFYVNNVTMIWVGYSNSSWRTRHTAVGATCSAGYIGRKLLQGIFFYVSQCALFHINCSYTYQQGDETGAGERETCRSAISTHSPELDSLVRSVTNRNTTTAINRIA